MDRDSITLLTGIVFSVFAFMGIVLWIFLTIRNFVRYHARTLRRSNVSLIAQVGVNTTLAVMAAFLFFLMPYVDASVVMVLPPLLLSMGLILGLSLILWSTTWYLHQQAKLPNYVYLLPV